ncbi:hypothetical protein NOR51B_2668 [Luminiphilus syltensis NOR5-1B]|uniref:Outer membrane protein beta-barrel domain-containing protein n=2 Tax=Luminiphilus TaxID=1341118 RepID=B8KVS2_9GAMM|nr:hypothetical protein NOR51B_2668 [Luminiphilus syltensis NOR5-1B]
MHGTTGIFCGLLGLALASEAMQVNAEEERYTLYGMYGENSDLPEEDAFGLGLLYHRPDSPWILGIDAASEGSMNNNGWIEPGVSFNGVIGYDVYETDSLRVSFSGLAGVGTESISCPPSYLGFDCYADREPDREFGFNGGGLLTLEYRAISIGFRATGRSQQFTFGFNF